MRRCLVHHPRRYAGARPVRLRNDDELDAAIGESPDYQYGLAAPGMERIVDPPLDRVFVGSLSLFRGLAARRGLGQPLHDGGDRQPRIWLRDRYGTDPDPRVLPQRGRADDRPHDLEASRAVAARLVSAGRARYWAGG